MFIVKVMVLVGLFSFPAIVGCSVLPDPTNVVPSVHLYVADGGNHRIVRLDDIEGRGWMILGGTIFSRTYSREWIKPTSARRTSLLV